MLDLLHEPLETHGFEFLRLDGSVSQVKREELLAKFKESSIPLLLVSLRAGGVGLNLTAANNCFLLDLW
jgi:SNF2 family DNA or RNA helicase